MLRSKSGETIVEVIASIFIFLIMLAILQGAVSYSRAMMQKNKEIRAENAAIINSLASAEPEVMSSRSIGFMAVNSDMTEAGNTVFSVTANLCHKRADYADADGQPQSVLFTLYAPQTHTGADAGDDTGGGGE